MSKLKTLIIKPTYPAKVPPEQRELKRVALHNQNICPNRVEVQVTKLRCLSNLVQTKLSTKYINFHWLRFQHEEGKSIITLMCIQKKYQ
jgi:hypothetical protein